MTYQSLYKKYLTKFRFQYFENRLKKNCIKNHEKLKEAIEFEDNLKEITGEYQNNDYFEFNKMLKVLYIVIGD